MRTLAQRSPFYPPEADQPSSGLIITPASPQFSASRLVESIGGIIGSGAWLSINDPIAAPFYLRTRRTCYQLGVYNGSSVGENFDVGIYDGSWNRIISTGSTACSGTVQFVDVADTVLQARTLYYLVQSRDNITANRMRRWNIGTAPGMGLIGIQSSATDAFPLPDPLTNMALVSATFTTLPVMMIALRALV